MQEVGADRVGVRLTPYGAVLDCFDSAPKELFPYVVSECAKRKVAYVHMITARVKGATSPLSQAHSGSVCSDMRRCAVWHVRCVRGCDLEGG